MSSSKGQASKAPAKAAAASAPAAKPAAAAAPVAKPAVTKPTTPAAAPAAKPAAPKEVNGKEKKLPKDAVKEQVKESSPQPKETPKAKQAAKESTPEPERNPEDEKLNPFVEVIAKRLRALKKRLVKIEKNLELQAQGQKLDQDQLKSISQRVEVLHLITELEDISKNFQEVLFEEDKLDKVEKKRQALEEQKKIAALKEQQQQEFKKILEPVYLLSVFGDKEVRALLSTQGVEGFSLSQEELQTLEHVTTALCGKYQAREGLTESSKRFFNRVKKLSTKNTENAAPGITYTTAQSLISKISVSPFFDPELATKLAKERAEREASEEAARRELEEMQNSYELIAPEEIPPFAPMSPEQMNGLPGGAALAFMGASEVLGVQPVLSFDGSPAVVVPIPQLFYSQIATPIHPLSYSSFRPTIPHHHQQPIQPIQPIQPTAAAAQEVSAALSQSSSSQPQQDGSIATHPNNNQQQIPQRYQNQNPRGRGTGYRNYPPQERNFQDNKYPDQRRYNSAPQDRSYQGYQERGQQDRPPLPRAERGGARGGRGGFRGAKAPQPQTA